MAPTGEEGGGVLGRGREGGTGGRTRGSGREASSAVETAGNGRSAAALPTRPSPGIATFFFSPGILSYPSFFFRRFLPVANPLGGGASRSREAAGEGRRSHQGGGGRPDFSQTGKSVTKSIAMCRIEMKRCRFGVQNGVSECRVTTKYR